MLCTNANKMQIGNKSTTEHHTTLELGATQVALIVDLENISREVSKYCITSSFFSSVLIQSPLYNGNFYFDFSDLQICLLFTVQSYAVKRLQRSSDLTANKASLLNSLQSNNLLILLLQSYLVYIISFIVLFLQVSGKQY